MRHFRLALIFILLTPSLTFSQSDNEQWLAIKFKNSDTILLISHDLVAGSTDVVMDNNGNEIPFPKLFINGKLNRQVLTEEQSIGGNDIATLVQILARPNKDSVTSQGGCFVPRQSIILIKNGKTSYIDICFHCGSYDTSKDLQNIPAFDDRRWTELEDYFRQHGLKYKLDNVRE